MSSSIGELEDRLSELKILAGQLQREVRLPSAPLEENSKIDPLVSTAWKLKVPLLAPLTIGTLLASVLGEIYSEENALKSLTYH